MSAVRIPARISTRTGAILCTALAMTLSVSACRGSEDRAKLAEQDDGLASNDSAVKGPIEDQIMVDQNLVGQSNANSASTGARPVDGAVPTTRGGGSAADAAGDVRTRVAGTLLRAPAPGRYEDACDGNCDANAARPATLGGLARQQGAGGCAADISYGASWAQRLPTAFPMYPRAALVEAAGVMNGSCNVRVVNFRSRAGMQPVLDFYYTVATRNGYTAEHLLRGSEHYLGGTRGDEAFVIMARPMAGGLIDVDMVVTGGR
jgi:hypothetical protein